jgi:cyclopropane fatty-acyl-phospholipid synthase-like methyltransferase
MEHRAACEPSEDTVSEAQDYPLGYSAQEAQRLADQGAQLEELTEDVLRRAGLRRGMQVLDIGSGAGDVSLLAAKMIGSDGAVLGIGIANIAEIGIDTLAERLREDAVANERVIFLSRVVGAWARLT